MKYLLIFTVLFIGITFIGYSQMNDYSLKVKPEKLTLNSQSAADIAIENPVQLKKRKTVSTYFGAGYSFMIFTSEYMQDAFPIFDIRNGTFLTNINLFIGFAVAQALTLEFEPTILFFNSDKIITYELSEPYRGIEKYGHTLQNSILAFPLMANFRFFPMFKSANFSRLFFIGGGAGAIWMREENDIEYSNDPNGGSFYGTLITQESSQWSPMFRLATGFTGTGGQFGFGGELRYNFVPLDQNTTVPFATRFASNANSFDICLRFYFSL